MTIYTIAEPIPNSSGFRYSSQDSNNQILFSTTSTEAYIRHLLDDLQCSKAEMFARLHISQEQGVSDGKIPEGECSYHAQASLLELLAPQGDDLSQSNPKALSRTLNLYRIKSFILDQLRSDNPCTEDWELPDFCDWLLLDQAKNELIDSGVVNSELRGPEYDLAEYLYLKEDS